MRDLEQLLRYEIPGFLIIVYFLIFSRDIIIGLPAPDESNWWEQHENPAIRNEVLDIAFYSSDDKIEAAHILERFINFFHSARVIGMYVPVFSIILHLFLASLARMGFEYMLSRCVAAVILYGGYYCIITKGRIPEDRLCRTIKALHIVVILSILLICLNNPICLFLLFLFVVWLLSIPRTLEGGVLKRRIDELETNVLLSRQRDIVEAIGDRLNLT